MTRVCIPRIPGLILLLLTLLSVPPSAVGAASVGAPGALPHAARQMMLTHNGSSIPLAWSPDSRWLLYGVAPGAVRDPGGKLWLVSADGRVRRELAPRNHIADAAFLPDGRHILYARSSTTGNVLVLVLISLTGKVEREIRIRDGSFLPSSTSGPGGEELRLALAVHRSGHVFLQQRGIISDLDPLSGRIVRLSAWRIPAARMPNGGSFDGGVLSPDGRLLASYTGRVYAVPSGKLLRVLPHRWPFTPRALAWAPDSRTLAYEDASDQCLLCPFARGSGFRIVDVRTGRKWDVPNSRLPFPGIQAISAFSWSPHGTVLSFSNTLLAGTQTTYGAIILFIDRTGHRVGRMDAVRPLVTGGEVEPLWAPNGQAIAFSRDRWPRNYQEMGFDVAIAHLSGPRG